MVWTSGATPTPLPWARVPGSRWHVALVTDFDLSQRVPNPQTPGHVMGEPTELGGKAASEKMKLGTSGVTDSVLCQRRFADRSRGVFLPPGASL